MAVLSKTVDKTPRVGKVGIYSMWRSLAERRVCPNCTHLHRPILRNQCECCGKDYTDGDNKLDVEVTSVE